MFKEDYKNNPKLYDSLSDVKDEKLHVQLPSVSLRTNLETAIADTYYIGTVLYPETFSDIDPLTKADEIYVNFLGKPFYSQMVKDYRDFGNIKWGLLFIASSTLCGK